MYISSIKIKNYKSYLESEVLKLKPGFNIVVGQNNAGKTALLEALSLGSFFVDKPHLSEKTKPRATSNYHKSSYSEVSVVVTGEELKETLGQPGLEYCLPEPAPNTEFPNGHRYISSTEMSKRALSEWFLQSNPIEVRGVLIKSQGNNEEWSLAKIPSFVPSYKTISKDVQAEVAYVQVHNNGAGEVHRVSNIHSSSRAEVGVGRILPYFRNRIYCFRAERLNIGKAPAGLNSELSSDAANLPEVLNLLEGNHSLMRKFNELVTTIFPQIQQISLRPQQVGGQIFEEIMVWNHDPDTGREDLAVPLSECGTGLGQVLAMLYVVLTSKYPRTIIIDEPNSFLHPGAVRKLMQILKQYDSHQYVIATHSPSVVSSVNAATITMISCNGGESTFKFIDSNDNEDLAIILAEVGATLGDVFGADSIVWVEGRTEELALPKILEQKKPGCLNGVVIKGVINTGDFEGDHADLILNVYKKLSETNSLMPPALGFIFDGELRTNTKKNDLIRLASPVTFLFTQRRMFENYLLEPEAIVSVMNKIDGFSSEPILVEVVEKWLADIGQSKKYGAPSVDCPSSPWSNYVNAGLILKDLFSELSEGRVEYAKTRHSVALVDWLLENKPEQLEELANLVMAVLNSDLAT